MTSNMTLPTHMLTTMPQNSSGWEVMTLGPGVMPWISIAPPIRAITALEGMPRLREG